MRSTTTTRRLAGAALLLPLLLVGCAGEDPTTDAGTEDTAPEGSEETSETVEETTEPAADVDYAAVDLGEPGDPTEPGTDLAFGEAAWVERPVDPADEESETTLVGVSVLDVVEGDPALFQSYSNAEEFDGYTPYLVVTQYRWTDAPVEGEDPAGVDLFPLAEDGTDLEYLTSGFSPFSGATDECGLTLPEYDAEAMQAVSCFVGLTTDEPVAVVEFNGEDYGAMFADAENEYFESPITWTR